MRDVVPDIDPDDAKVLRGFGLLTAKPLLILLNIPLALFAFVLGARRFPRAPRPQPSAGQGSRTDSKGAFDLDLLGIGLFAGTLVALLLFLMHPRIHDWYLLVIVVTAAVAFTARELSHVHPFIDLRLLGRNAPLLLTYTRALLAYVVSYSFIYGYTQWLEDGRGLSAGQAGLATLPLFATGIVVSLVSGRRTAVRGKLVVAALGQIAGCVLLLTLNSSAAIWLLIVVALVFGIPQGLNSLALQNSVYRQANPDDIGASAGLLRTFGYLGAIVSAAAQGAFYGRSANTVGLHHIAVLLIGIGVAFLLITVLDRSLGRSTDETTPARGKDRHMPDRHTLDPNS